MCCSTLFKVVDCGFQVRSFIAGILLLSRVSQAFETKFGRKNLYRTSIPEKLNFSLINY